MFIYDEAIKSTPSRKAMSQINTKWLEYIPELSKARCHFFVITQAKDYTESIFLNPIFSKAEWHKIDKTTVQLMLPRKSERFIFYDVPPTSLIYDPYSQAIWKMQAENPLHIKDEDIQIMFDYAQLSSEQIKQKYPFLQHRTEVMRRVKAGIRKVQMLLQVTFKRSGGNMPVENETTL